MKRMRIGLAGFYGYGNYGDELFLKVFRQFLGVNHQLEVIPEQLEKPYFVSPLEKRVKRYDAIVIGGGDIVQPWGIDARYFSREYLEKPVFVVGVGVPLRSTDAHAEKAWVVEKYKAFFSHPNVRFVHARDVQSAQWIQKKIEPAVKVQEGPDIVCALNLPPVPLPNDAPILGVVTRQRSATSQDDYTQVQRLCRHAQQQGWSIRHIILGFGGVGEADFRNADALDVPGKELVYTQNLDEMSRAIGGCSAFASMKFHGTVVATMYGIPSIVMVPTNKNRNFMNRIGLGEQVARFDSEKLVSIFDAMPKALSARHVSSLRFGATALMTRLRAEVNKLAVD